MKADKYGTPAEQARAEAQWHTAAKGEGRCDGCQRSDMPVSGNGAAKVHCPWLGCASKPNATCEFHSPIPMPRADEAPDPERVERLLTRPWQSAEYVRAFSGANLATLRSALKQTGDPHKIESLTHLIRSAERSDPQPESTPMTDTTIEATADPFGTHAELMERSGLPTTKPTGTDIDQAEAVQVAGMLQGMALVSKLLTVSTIKILAQMKESRKYRGATLLSGGKLLTVSSWEEYCTACGLNFKHVDENIRNLASLGEDFLEYSNQVGLGYRDLRKLRQLPQEDRAVVLGEVEIATGDKEAIVELIDNMAAKHAKEKADLEKQIGDKEADLAASRKAHDDTAKKLAETKEALERRKANVPNQADRDRATTTLKTSAEAVKSRILASFRKECLDVLDAHDGESSEFGRVIVAQALGIIMAAARQVGADLGVVPAQDALTAFEQGAMAPGEKAWRIAQAELATGAEG
jgi:hypothetical protein